MLQKILVITGALLQLCQAIPFLVEMMRGKAKPNIVSWSTWMLLTGIGSAAGFASGDWPTGVIVGASGLGTAAIVTLGFWKGYAKLTSVDAVCQVAALAAFATWPLLHGPVLAVVVAVTIDAIAAMATLYHAYRKPHEEVWASYAVSGTGSLCGILALNEFTIVSSLYLFYLVTANALLAAMILARRRMVRVEANG
jgi:hypothetical protein